jgi:hypothetical protein
MKDIIDNDVTFVIPKLKRKCLPKPEFIPFVVKKHPFYFDSNNEKQ